MSSTFSCMSHLSQDLFEVVADTEQDFASVSVSVHLIWCHLPRKEEEIW